MTDAPQPLACLFPGQGSQAVGMGASLMQSYPEARRTFEEADDALGEKLSDLCVHGPEESLQLTANAQPAILTVSIAALRVARTEFGVRPTVAAGHSLGEYSALVAADVLSFGDAVRLARRRGLYMQEAVPAGAGAMAAIIGLSPEAVAEACAEARGAAPADTAVVSPANFNGPDQIVISGHACAVDLAVQGCTARGAKRAILLKVSAPFHCSLMEPAALRLEEALGQVAIRPFAFPVVSNVTAALENDHTRVKSLLVQQVCSPVRWVESMRALGAAGVREAVELGPGRVLTGLARRIDRELSVKSLPFAGESDG